MSSAPEEASVPETDSQTGRAIEPLRDNLDDSGFERLVSALAIVIGWEALIVLQDLRGCGSGGDCGHRISAALADAGARSRSHACEDPCRDR
jgi:hypothetical protein